MQFAVHPPSTPALRRDIARIAVPVSLEMVFQLALSFIDQIIVGFLGTAAVAAVGLANSLGLIAILTFSTLGAGAAILSARAHGAGDQRGVSRTTSTAMVLATIIALVAGTGAAAFAGPLLRLSGAEASVVLAATPYFQLLMLSLPLIVIGAVSSAVLRSLGHARTPMTVTFASVAVNTVVAYLLVFGAGPFPELGLLGAGIATVIAQALKAVVLTAQLYGRRLARWELPAGKSEWRRESGELLHLTLPLTATELAWTTGTFVYTIMFARIGVNALAASQIVHLLEAVFVLGSFGLTAAATALIGQSVGRRDAREAQTRASVIVRTGILTGIAFGLLFVASAFLLPTFFPKVAEETLHIAFWGVVINGVFQVVKVHNMVHGIGVLPSGGDTRGVLLGDAVGAFVVGIPLALLLAFGLGLGVWGLFAARILEELAKFAIFEWRARRISWQALAEGRVKPAH